MIYAYFPLCRMHIKKTCAQGLKSTLFTASSGTFLSHTAILVFCIKFFICRWRIRDKCGWTGYHCPVPAGAPAALPTAAFVLSANSNTVGKSDWRLSALLKSFWCCRINKRVFGFLDHPLRTARVDDEAVSSALWFTSRIQGRAPTGGSLNLVYIQIQNELVPILISKPPIQRVIVGLRKSLEMLLPAGDLAPSILYTKVVNLSSTPCCK